MQNTEIAEVFAEVADLLEIQGANPFRIRAYRNAARVLHDLTDSVAERATDGDLAALPSIGKDLAGKIATLLETGSLPQLEELRQAVPRGVADMTRLPGVGPKKAAVLFQELGVKSLADLKTAAEAGQVAALKGFGAKTQTAILASIERAAEAASRTLLADATVVVEPLITTLRGNPAVICADVAGSYRRRQETVGDLDLLTATDAPEVVMDALAADRAVEAVLQRGPTKMRVRLRQGLELDLRVLQPAEYGAGLVYFTGSQAHNIALRRLANGRGLKLSEYGVFRGEVRLAAGTEEEVYAALGLPWIPPELREDRGELAAAAGDALPRLVTTNDLRGDLHMHTTASDGQASIREMAEAAQALGHEYIAITDHSQRVSMAHGLDAQRLRQHWQEIERVNAEMSGITLLKGIECDILEDARMDLSDDVLAEADWVLAVLHYGLKQPGEQIMRRLLAAIQNPFVDAIGHPSGRLIGRREPAAIDWPTFHNAAADYGLLLEINSSPQRLDLSDVQARAAADRGIKIVINTDAHSTEGLSGLPWGVNQARRAGLEAKDVANTLPLAEFRKLLKRNR